MNKTRVKVKAAAKIPPPPGLEDGYDAIIEYHKKYSMEELEEAGYLEEVPDEYSRKVQAGVTYQLIRDYGLKLKLSRRDCRQLVELAASQDQDVETLVKGWVKEQLGHAGGILRNGAVRKSAEKVER